MRIFTTFAIFFVPLIMVWAMGEVSISFKKDPRPSKMGFCVAQSCVILASVAFWAAASYELHLTYV